MSYRLRVCGLFKNNSHQLLAGNPIAYFTSVQFLSIRCMFSFGLITTHDDVMKVCFISNPVTISVLSLYSMCE